MAKLVILFFSVCFGAQGLRKRKSTRWSTKADGRSGPCADIVIRDLDGTMQQGDLPVGLPFLCTGQATGVVIKAKAFGHSHALLKLKVNGEFRADMRYHVFPWGHWKTMQINLGTFTKGTHTIWLEGSRIDLSEVVMEGNGASCSLTDAAGHGEALGNFLYTGLDSVHRIFTNGGDKDYPSLRKNQLYFSSESFGTSLDRSISSTVVANGLWQWMLKYSQNYSAEDPWGGNPGGLWKEAKLTPWKKVKMSRVPGMRFDSQSDIVEPCNSLSNIAFHQAANWISCKGYDHMTRDEYASIITGFNALAPGSFFFHACACRVGGRGDTLPMDWLLYQIHQTMVMGAIQEVGSGLTPDEKATIKYLGFPGDPEALEISRQMTRLFSQKYDTAIWNETFHAIKVPPFDKAVAGIVGFVAWGIESYTPIPGFGSLLDSLLGAILGLLSPGDVDWFRQQYTPAVRKLWSKVRVCNDVRGLVVGKILSFAVTFVEALVFQEQQLPTPPVIRSILDAMRAIGLDSSLLNDMRGDWDMYNGFDCERRSDHARWHAVAAQGLVHISEAADVLRGRSRKSC